MYAPSHFAFDDPDELHQFIAANNFGTLVCSTDGQLSVSRLPFLLDQDGGHLYGHLARANPHWQKLTSADDLIVTFDGPHGYISPTWYGTANLVPTWNYVSAMVRGSATLIDAPEPLWDLVRNLTVKHEVGRGPAWDADKLPADKRKALLGAIVGFQVTISGIYGKRKLSQNRAAADVEGAIAGLTIQNARSPADKIADYMRRALGHKP